MKWMILFLVFMGVISGGYAGNETVILLKDGSGDASGFSAGFYVLLGVLFVFMFIMFKRRRAKYRRLRGKR